jgi:hypothetical protein
MSRRAPSWRLSESEVDLEEMHVHTGFVGTVCASIREMLEAVLCKNPGMTLKPSRQCRRFGPGFQSSCPPNL